MAMAKMVILSKASILAFTTLFLTISFPPTATAAGAVIAAAQTENERRANLWERLATNEKDLNRYDGYLDASVERKFSYNIIKKMRKLAIDGNQYECDVESADLRGIYSNNLIANLSEEEWNAFLSLNNDFSIRYWPVYAAIHFNELSTDFYPDKQRANLFNRRLSDLKNFWDITPFENTQIGAWDMNLVLDQPLMLASLELELDLSREEAQDFYDGAIELIEMYPAVGLHFPLYSFSTSYFIEEDLSKPATNFIFIGNALAQFMEENLGLGASGTEFVLFYVYVGIVQLVNHIPELRMERTPEISRYIVLMADAMAAYYAYHPRGAAFQTKRMIDVMEAAYSFGDCKFDSRGHRGTPNQREKAVQFAIDLIDNVEGGKGKILPSAEFIELFRAAYDDIVAPDAV